MERFVGEVVGVGGETEFGDASAGGLGKWRSNPGLPVIHLQPRDNLLVCGEDGIHVKLVTCRCSIRMRLHGT